MFQLIRNWLNGSQEYFTGMALLKRCNPAPSETILVELRKGPTEINRKRLREMLAAEFQKNAGVSSSPTPQPLKTPKNAVPATTLPVSPSDHSKNPICIACKREADNLYKQMMNERAVLFAGIRSLQPHEDPNRPDLIQKRKKPCIDIAMMAIKVGRLYNRADYALKHGKIPEMEFAAEQCDADNIPDHLVKQRLDNLRKNISKMSKREPTPERLTLILSHRKSIETLESRWKIIRADQESK
jgi:hypothetical protein